jgi:excinuclease UvrABC ATPase subunit
MFHWDPSRPPYPGLLAFQEQDAAIFFGRDDEIRGGLDRLNSLRSLGGARLVLFLGASGSGKSSLVRAGLLPRLRRDADS